MALYLESAVLAIAAGQRPTMLSCYFRRVPSVGLLRGTRRVVYWRGRPFVVLVGLPLALGPTVALYLRGTYGTSQEGISMGEINGIVIQFIQVAVVALGGLVVMIGAASTAPSGRAELDQRAPGWRGSLLLGSVVSIAGAAAFIVPGWLLP